MAKNRWIRCIAIAISILLATTSMASAQTIGIGLLTGSNISSVLLSPTSGKYVLLNEKSDTLYRFRSDDAISISMVGTRLLVKSAYGLNDTLNKAAIVGRGDSPAVKIRVNEEKQEHIYFNELRLSVSGGSLKLVNRVDIEQYVGRVVQGEVGNGAKDEYYKIQSILCRTYAVRNLERHAMDGFDLCDHEHCQVYSGRKPTSNEIVKATAATNGLVMTSKENNLILSAFHANCGGQTSNSEDVWQERRSYLTSVEDTFCLGSRSANWTKSLPLTEFLTQLGFSEDTTGLNGWKFDQDVRKKLFTIRKDSMELSKLRILLQLRSTFFDLEIKNGQANFTGRGYGHGVGLCQQGAMKMAEVGYTYSQILGYYYKGVSLVPITSLPVQK